MKIVKYVLITISTGYLLFSLSIMIIGGYYVGSNESWLIKRYKFDTNNITLHNSLKGINSLDNNIIIKDILIKSDSKDKNDLYDTLTRIQIKNKKTSEMTNYTTCYSESYSQNLCRFNLIYINGKTNDDFGWFSWEKYKAVKLFEESIIDPLSKKHEKIE